MITLRIILKKTGMFLILIAPSAMDVQDDVLVILLTSYLA